MISIALAALLVAASASCSSAEGSGNNTGSGSGSQVSTDTGKYYDKVMSASDVIKDAASEGRTVLSISHRVYTSLGGKMIHI